MTIDQIRDEAIKLHAEHEVLFSKRTTEGREYTDAEKAEQDKRFSRIKLLKEMEDEHKKFAALALAKGDVTLPVNPPGKAEFDASEGRQNGGGNATQPAKIDAAQFSKAVADWSATGEMEKRFATITTATQSGVYLPREIAATVVPTSANSFRQGIAIQGMESVSIITTPTTAALTVPVATGAAGGVVAENAGSETENTPSLSESIDLKVSTFQSGSVYYSNLILSAGAVDVVNSVVPTLTYEKELGLEAAATAAIVADAGVTQVVTLTGIVAAGLTYAKLVALNRALPKRFDAKKVILLSDDAYSTADGLTDSTGQPILSRDPQNQELLRFNGTPVIRSSYLEAFGASKVVGVVISLLGFRLRDVSGSNLARYTQVPGKPNQTGFNLFAYHAYGYAASAVAKLKTSAS